MKIVTENVVSARVVTAKAVELTTSGDTGSMCTGVTGVVQAGLTGAQLTDGLTLMDTPSL